MKKILNGTVELDHKHRIVITLPPCWKYIEGKLSKEIKVYCKKYLFKESWKMNEKELEEKEKFDEDCDLLCEIYEPFFNAVKRQKIPKKGKKYQSSLQRVALPY